MTREDIKSQFPEATEEQVTALLNIHGTDLTNAKKSAVDTEEIKRLQEIEGAYQKLKDADLTDAEQIQKALDEAQNSKFEFDKKSARLEVEKIFVAAGLKADDYEAIIEGVVSDDAEKSKAIADGLVKMISSQKEAAVKKANEDLMDNTPTGSMAGSNKEDEKTEAEKVAETLATQQKSATDVAKTVMDNYV